MPASQPAVQWWNSFQGCNVQVTIVVTKILASKTNRYVYSLILILVKLYMIASQEKMIYCLPYGGDNNIEG
jgi:hypothetical protein